MASAVVSQDLPAGAVTTDRPPMRGRAEGLRNPKPYGRELPALLQDDEFCMRLAEAFDDSTAPVFASLDCFTSYLDVDLSPEDFLDWLGGWVGVDVDQNWPVDRRRMLIRRAVELYRMRGTAGGLAAHLELYSGTAPEIHENGGCMWSQTADTPLPGSADPYLSIHLTVPDATTVSRATVERIISSSRPAHLAYTMEIATAAGKVVAEPAQDAPGAGGDGDGAPGAVDLPGSERIDLAAPGPDGVDEIYQEGPGPDAPDGGEPPA